MEHVPVGPAAGLVLAAGGGRRLGGRPKALLERGGRPLVELAVAALLEGGCGLVQVVLGAGAAEVRARAVLPGGVVLVENEQWREGMGSSLRAGLASLAGTRADAAVVTLVDQPFIGARAVARVLAAHRAGADLVTAAYGGIRGHPVLLGRAHWAAVAHSAAGDRGARAYLREHAGALVAVECGDVAAPDDIDAPGDLPLLDRDFTPGAPPGGTQGHH
ncbi:nucleotidyltransferase family protein [Streptomyces sp. NPDC049577]|uniref:nucleotidyltransferase family protein n=1 Tax=Streptomyces sp. NPDC049577 TaxID=3155153 RepID=UPI00344AC77B